MVPDDRAFSVLEAVGALPTAPLHEQVVARHLARATQALGLTARLDPYGNLFVSCRQGSKGRAGGKPGVRPLALVAHMDHPGVAVTHAGGRQVSADVLGGLAASVLAPETPLRLYHDDWSTPARILQYLPPAGGMRAALRLEAEDDVPEGAFGMLDLPGCVRIGDFLAMRAADDLAQCACLLLTAERLASTDDAIDVTFVFTRAEEIGLVGASLVAQSGSLAHDTIVISLECSRALPGAELGHGPVIRVGDAVQSFHPEGEALLIAARDQLLRAQVRPTPAERPLEVQRQLMSGGSCEATAFQAYGYVATGLALPLGNYHNADSNGHAAPEYIHMRDLLGAVDLLLAAVAEAGHPTAARPARWQRAAERLADRLRSSAAGWGLGLPPLPPPLD